MAIECAVSFRRSVQSGLSLGWTLGLSVLIAMLCVCGIASAQTTVTSGSVVPTTHPLWGQIMKVVVAKNGSVIFLDWSTSGLYQLRPGASTFTTIASGAPLEASGTFWNSGMTIDAKDTIYIADRYGSAHFFRIPYNPADGTYDFTSSNSWGGTIGNGSVSLNTYDVAFINSAAADGSGTLVVSTETSPEIYTVPVDNQANWGTPTVVVKGLKGRATHIAADVNGNIYFTEDEGTTASGRSTGVFFIPAGKTGVVGAGDGTAEAQLARIDPSSNTDQFSGISLDSAGNIYLSSQADQNGGAFNGDLMVPNTSGNPVGVTVSSFDYDNAIFLTPVQTSAPVTIDPRGYLWIPTGTGGWTPPGSLAYPGTKNVVLWQPGAASAGTAPVGTPNTTTPGTVFFNFSNTVTPASIAFSQPGTGSDFLASSTNPIADPAATTPQLPCTAGKQYGAFTTCPYFVALNPRSAGAISGQVSMLDGTNKLIAGSKTYLSGVGQAAAISLSVPTSQTTVGSGLVAPQQVAADALGNSYVADSTLGKVLEFAAGATASTAGVPVGTGLTAPTGVAVDGSGDVFIADSGKVIEVPFVNGALSAASQTTLKTGLGSDLKLAVGGSGNVFVADPDNARVVEIQNSLTASVVHATETVGSGFTKPSALALDSAGDIFVADGNTLFEITATFDGPPAAITNSLAGPVTGLAVDPSGSVDVEQSGGIIHIPATAGVLSANSAVALDSGVLTAPNGLAIDGFGNLFVSDLTGGKANLQLLSLNAAVDFGQVGVLSPSNPVDVNVFNIGNAPLTLSPDPTFSGADAADFSTTPASLNACDTTGATPVAPGSSCIIDVLLTAGDVGTRTGTMTVTSNAVNAASVTASLTGVGENNLARSVVALTLNPATGVTYPGVTTVTVNVSALAGGAVPTGQVILTLTNQNAKLHQSTTYPAGNLSAGVTTFSLTGVLGGTYTVKAVYHGDTNFGGGLATTTLTVAQAIPGVSLSEPSNITPIQGVYYVLLGSNTTLSASVTSKVGTPTGTVSFMNGTTVADSTQNPVGLDANGTATFSTENLLPGTYNLTAVYNSDQNFSTVTSPAITFQVIPKSVLITASPAMLSITPGTPVQTLLTLQSLVGYAATNKSHGGVFIACDNTTVPQYTECTFDVPQVEVPAGASGTTTLTISSNLPVNVGSVRTGPAPFAFAGLFGVGLLGLAFRRRAGLYRGGVTALCLMFVLAGSAAGVSGCTNSGYTTTPPAPHVVTPAGTYNVGLYATDPVSGKAVTLPFTIAVTVK
jgi:hypothetical protein